VGTLRVRFVADVQAHEQARVLSALRKLKATVRHRPQDAGPEEWHFDTRPLAVSKRPITPKTTTHQRVLSDREWAKRYAARMWSAIERASTGPIGDLAAGWHDAVASWNDSLWSWDRLTRAKELAAAVAIARSITTTPFASFPRQTKGAGMSNNPNWQDHDRDLRELYAVAADLVAGRRGPEEHRARGADPRLLMPAFGRTPLIVGVWDDPYGPLAAMCVAGFILYGTAFEDRFARMGITGDLIDAYEILARHYGPRVPRLEAATASTTSLAKALEAPRADRFLKLTGKKPTPPLNTPRRPALVGGTSRPALPDLGGRS
jgi:hypothetical protein